MCCLKREIYIRKRKRQVLEEENDVSDGEYEKMLPTFTQDIGDAFELPKDTTGMHSVCNACMHDLISYYTGHAILTIEWLMFCKRTRADPTIVIDADSAVGTTRALKALSFPVMDSDGLPSSYAQKILQAIGKWRAKLFNMGGTLQEVEDPPENVRLFLS